MPEDAPDNFAVTEFSSIVDVNYVGDLLWSKDKLAYKEDREFVFTRCKLMLKKIIEEDILNVLLRDDPQEQPS